ncbi:antibiotic biosynthesis monooxygenase [Dokdonella soli]|uniref:ABM domain-containing protein n=1 Tax=Dokdonella soli TaxID=529810 RepID=A0ABN1IJ69_9GAMM
MITSVWRFRVIDGAVAAFEEAYGPRGDWARLFSRAAGFIGTELLRLDGDEPVYLTIDRWNCASDYHHARAALDFGYAALDRRCEAYTSEETWLGLHTVIE